jgi:hypothetical protein
MGKLRSRRLGETRDLLPIGLGIAVAENRDSYHCRERQHKKRQRDLRDPVGLFNAAGLSRGYLR